MAGPWRPGSWDHTVRLWDVETGSSTGIFRGHGAEVWDVSFSPDGRTVASASFDHTVRLWEVATGAVAILQGHEGWVVSLDFSPDGSTLVSGSDDIRLWDLATGHAATIATGGGLVAFSPDGRTLASGFVGTASIALWDLGSRSAVTMAEGHFGGASRSVALAPDGTTLAAVMSYDKVHLWDLRTGTNTAILEGHAGRLNAVVFSPDGATLASASSDRTVKLWHVPTGAEITTLEAPDGAWISAVAFSPDGGSIASGDGRGRVTLWDVASGVRTVSWEGDDARGIGSLAFSPDGTTLAAGSAGLAMWDLSTGASILTEQFPDAVYAVSFTPDGTALALGRPDRSTISIWKVPPGSNRATLSIEYPAHISTAAFSPDGTIVVSGTLDFGNVDVLEVRDVATGALIATLKGHGEQVGTLGFAPDGATFASGSDDGTVLVWDLERALLYPRTMTELSGGGQEGGPGAVLSEPFVIEVRDQNGDPLAGVRVLFRIIGRGGALSEETSETDARGRAATTLTLGEELGPIFVEAIVEGLEPVTFTATLVPAPDFDGDGEVGFSDFFLFAEHFGGTDPRFDLDASGSVDFPDFFLFAEHFGEPARARLVALAREMIGLPEGAGLQQNSPNPFNSQTVISWFVLEPGVARLEVFALTGQRVAVLHDGPQEAGLRHRLRWDGRDDQGRALASGVYVYRLVTARGAQTRKLTLLR